MDGYYHSSDLARFPEIGKGNQELWEKFAAYYSAVFAEGTLTEREKALIALGVAHAVQCPYCIDAYTQACLEKGSNIEEMTEAVHVACAIRGGAALVHGLQMRNVAQKLSM
ncbi:MAG TPA: arsenosugar biosynthesis-associated peroxidase-like protein [Candidatus Acidoferrales bacterium]|nr:arsenosugar biosynthesis-associated peroxidase-like protein [Candidatus Acidoferrales bacterium]